MLEDNSWMLPGQLDEPGSPGNGDRHREVQPPTGSPGMLYIAHTETSAASPLRASGCDVDSLNASFYDFLHGLAIRYDRKECEVKTLQAENALLRKKLGEGTDFPSEARAEQSYQGGAGVPNICVTEPSSPSHTTRTLTLADVEKLKERTVPAELVTAPQEVLGQVAEESATNEREDQLLALSSALAQSKTDGTTGRKRLETPKSTIDEGQPSPSMTSTTSRRGSSTVNNMTLASPFKDFQPGGRFPPQEGWTRLLKQNSGWTRHAQMYEELDSNGKDGRNSSLQTSTAAAYNGVLKLFIAYPSSSIRLVWDFMGAILIFYDLFAIPVVMTLQPDESRFSLFMDWLTLVFWTLNMITTLTVGYVEKGSTIMDPWRIMCHYLKTWFIADLVVVVPDWIFSVAASMSSNEKSSEGSSIKLLRILRLVRMVRLLRLFKLRKIMQDINDLINSEFVGIFANIGKMIVLLLVANHIIACIWISVASLQDHENWIDALALEMGTDSDDVRESYLYATAFHWSITQFTPASMAVQPNNMYERSFAVAIVVFGLVGFSYVVGSITSSLAQLRSMHEDVARQFWDLRRFMKSNKIPLALNTRIQRYLEHSFQSKATKPLAPKDVKIFALLSEQLQSELKCNIYIPHLHVHPLFTELDQESKVTLERLATTGIDRKSFASTDKIFIPGEIAKFMYFVAEGQLNYKRLDAAGALHIEIVDKGEDWISEPVLWTPDWIHLGGLQAESDSDLILIDPTKFIDTTQVNPSAFALASRYARNYLDWLNDLNDDEMSDIAQGEDVSEQIRRFCESEDKRSRLGTTSAGFDTKPASVFRRAMSSATMSSSTLKSSKTWMS